ncbi:carbohydrate ABC transporter permease [Arthrobacter bambusae]|uniref:Multiple sugar transport system permease protein n=1 Tax=Arthrobacter bambusae TaxID=1338426 RepID=A0AAW8DH04_9MICC|nr:sugar ABC transporter permease [Arthrobacter bambusae]MDP9904660.1 multiple sugar transport system permease protein [Arthrobacter bambusae]MDQ0129476.1 multiple sugar transport system permease protein [Arthrobacter bambusae]MDQ0180911.1 multiple sugar transport system permease protein [Arthrobacter bambusae]
MTMTATGSGLLRASGPEESRSRNRNRAARREGRFGWLMISLSALSILIFTALPILFTFVLSFFSWDVISPPRFVGMQNFTRLTADTAVIHSFGVTGLLAALIVVLQIVIGLAMALLVQQRKSLWARSIFRTAFFLPLLVSAASISIVFSYLFDDHFGVINYYLHLLGIPQMAWLSSPSGATATIVIVAVWQKLGFVFILFVAALGSLPRDVLEAVALDGSGPIRTFFAIKLPLISPTIFFAGVIGLIDAMQIFDQPYVMTKGGPGDATTTTVMLIYRTAFQNIQFGYGSAISVVLFVLLLALTGMQFLISRKWVFYS